MKTPKTSCQENRPERSAIHAVHDLLLEQYGSRTPRKYPPLDGLILVILSQATNDLNCERAFRQLKSTFPNWDEARRAPVKAIADAIRTGGLANQKAARIKKILQQIYEESGELDLSWMHQASVEECRAFLGSFKGVGPKTIACVLLFFLEKPAFPVDTHVHRVAKRLGWIREKAGADEAHRVLEDAIPEKYQLNLHINLIEHGRALCRANGQGGPQCEACILIHHCDYAKAHNKKTVSAPLDRSQSTLEPNPATFFVTVES